MTRVAAIDCGTNSIRLLVADVPPTGGATDLVRRMEVVRLGQGVDATGRLAPEAIERTRLVLAEYAATARELGAEYVRMVATSATRDAANRADFEQMVLATLGRLPDVVPGREEAELARLAAEGEALDQRAAELREQLDRQTDPAYVERQARERLAYVLPGDRLVIVVDGEAVEGDAGTLDEAAAPAEPQPWFQGLMESVARADGDVPEEPGE